MAISPDDTRDDEADEISGAASRPQNIKAIFAFVAAIALTWWLRGWMDAHPNKPPAQTFVASQNKANQQTTPQNKLPNSRAPQSASSAGTILVHVAGKVKKPDVYALPPNSRVQDAIAKAGGATKDGDANALNLAAWAEDGQRLEVPPREIASAEVAPHISESRSAVSSATETSSPKVRPNSGVLSHSAKTKSGKPSPAELAKKPVDLNKASESELQQLPGVGPAMAARIIAYRSENGGFKVVDDLDNVRGVGEKKMEILRPLVRVR